jgi:hypothetical protein
MPPLAKKLLHHHIIIDTYRIYSPICPLLERYEVISWWYLVLTLTYCRLGGAIMPKVVD